MDALFATPGSSLFTSAVLTINVLSLLTMLAIIYEFRHVHRKRVDLMKELGENTRAMMTERRVLILLYVIGTLIVIFAPLTVFL